MPNEIIENFARERYNQIRVSLQSYRLDPYIREMEKAKGKNKGLIFPFARGLRFSALLIYNIREILLDSDLQANWGQIIDSAGEYCSGECDIIIHSGKHVRKWNGSNDVGQIMDFRFIKQKDVKAVISCKSYITKSTIEVDYLDNLKNYVSNVWLFAECCGPNSIAPIRAEAKALGYDNFWPLYTWNKLTGDVNETFADWLDFMEKIANL